MLSMNTNLQFNQTTFENWVDQNYYDITQLFNCFKYNFQDVLPYTEHEWKKDEDNIFDIFCQFVYEYSD